MPDIDDIIDYRLRSFAEVRDSLELDRVRLEFAIADRLRDAGVRVFTVTGRVKDPESFEHKVRRKPTREIEDALGFRIITFVESDIPAAEAVVREMFRVDESTRVNKVSTLNPDSFGYRSLQFVASELPLGEGSDRGNFRNWTAAGPLDKFEVQIRTILSHAWAEIEHERYKAAQHGDGVISPDDAGDREFALTAALLEQADNNLDRLARGDDIRRPTANTAPTPLSPKRFVETNRHSAQLDKAIFAALDLSDDHVILAERAVERSVSVAGWRSDAEIEAVVREHGDLARRMAIVCSDVTRSQIHTDADGYAEQAAIAFRGIGVYWLGLAVAYGPGHPERDFEPHLGIPEGRLAEYGVVAGYLREHPDESALSVRAKYWARRAPTGTSWNGDFPAITLD